MIYKLLFIHGCCQELSRINLTEHCGNLVQSDRSESPLYAARFGEIVDFTRGVADKIYGNPEAHTSYFNNFVTHTLDFKDLYTSGHWDQVLHHWLMMNIRSEQGDQAFASRLNTAMHRMDRDDILAAFAEKAVPLLVEKGKDVILETDNLNADHTILLFYQGECPLCEDALIDLANKYARLKE